MKMSKDIKQLGLIYGAVVLSSVASYSFVNYTIAHAISSCSAGSYEIGREDNGTPICKNEPTGCPYGDSIPLGPDCDKHKEAVKQVFIGPAEAAQMVVNYTMLGK